MQRLGGEDLIGELKAIGALDANGRVMHGVVKAMTDRQMRAVAEYAAGLR